MVSFLANNDTAAPSMANFLLIASPIPRDPPVTNAVLPLNIVKMRKHTYEENLFQKI